MRKTLSQWLKWLESLHPSEIELGLDRIYQVARFLLPDFFHRDASQSLPFKIITVGGTNGKGSTVAFLQSILIASGCNTGSYTSPHFLAFNERIKINSSSISDEDLCSVFEQIEQARGNISLTYFEYTTLAAIYYFIQQKCDIVVLEVGLGGRLDAVNLFDSAVSLITTVDLDHQDWLGDNISAIGYEKAGIFRKNKLAFYGDENIPNSVIEHASKLGSKLLQFGKDYHYSKNTNNWSINGTSSKCNEHCGNNDLGPLDLPSLVGEIQLKNACNAIMLLKSLGNEFTLDAINKGLKNTRILGRFQHLHTLQNTKIKKTDIFADVAHNPQAAKVLRDTLLESNYKGKTHAIFGILEDKDLQGVIKVLAPVFDSWHVIPLDSNRASSTSKIKQQIQLENNNVPISCYNDFLDAYKMLMKQIDCQRLNQNNPESNSEKDRIIIFGSFLTVASALAYFS